MKNASDRRTAARKRANTKSKVIGWVACLIVVLLACPIAHATENGGSAYVGGNEDFMAGALPPAGFYPILYNLWYTADELRDDNGDEVPVDFELDVYASVFRFIHVTDYKLLGADYAWHVIVPVLKQDLQIGAINFDQSSSGLGDIEFSPLILGWHFSKNMHLTGALDVWAPTGDYDRNDPSSVGRNYWTMAPILAATYISDGGFELSGKFQYLVNFENSDTDYTSGNEFILDYLIGQHVGNWNVGVNGLVYKQITDDEQNGHTVHDNKGQCISIGPAIQYNYKNMFFNFKAQFDTSVRNRPEGQKYWLKFMYAF